MEVSNNKWTLLVLFAAVASSSRYFAQGLSQFRPTSVYTSNLLQVNNSPRTYDNNHPGASYQNYYGANNNNNNRYGGRYQPNQGVQYQQNHASAYQISVLLRVYCASRNTIQIRITSGTANIYCIRDERLLEKVMFVTLPEQGMKESPFEHWISARLLMQAGGFVPVCALHCDEGSRPLVTPGNYTSPTQSSAFSVGCSNLLSAVCNPVCSDDIYIVDNGFVSCTLDSHVGSVCYVHCNEGFTNVGPASKACGSNLAWNEPQKFKCLVDEVAKAVKYLMKDEDLTADVALAKLYEQLDSHISRKSNASENSADEQVNEVIESLLAKIADSTTVTLKSLNRCAVRQSDRTDCGHRGIHPEECKSRGCCWDDSRIDTTWCFYKDSFRPANFTTKFTTKHPQYPYTTFNTLLQEGLFRPSSRFTPEVEPPMLPNQLQPQHDSSSIQPEDFNFENPGAIEPSEDQCGCVAKQVSRCLSTPMARVFCGTPSKAQTYPWHATIFYGDKLCGGTLISKNFVLTAAHCLELAGVKDNDKDNWVFLGITERLKDDPNKQGRRMKRIIRHPLFQTLGDGFSQNDIAIIQLSSPVKLTNNVRVLCLPGKRIPAPGQTCYLTGFGHTETGDKAKILQSAPLPVVPVDQCNRYYGNRLNPSQNMCAGVPGKESPDACRGDSGGPLACKSQGGNYGCSWYLAGITSFGHEPCGGWPGVYVNVSHYQNWITSHIAGL